MGVSFELYVYYCWVGGSDCVFSFVVVPPCLAFEVEGKGTVVFLNWVWENGDVHYVFGVVCVVGSDCYGGCSTCASTDSGSACSVFYFYVVGVICRKAYAGSSVVVVESALFVFVHGTVYLDWVGDWENGNVRDLFVDSVVVGVYVSCSRSISLDVVAVDD